VKLSASDAAIINVAVSEAKAHWSASPNLAKLDYAPGREPPLTHYPKGIRGGYYRVAVPGKPIDFNLMTPAATIAVGWQPVNGFNRIPAVVMLEKMFPGIAPGLRNYYEYYQIMPYSNPHINGAQAFDPLFHSSFIPQYLTPGEWYSAFALAYKPETGRAVVELAYNRGYRKPSGNLLSDIFGFVSQAVGVAQAF